MSKLDPEVVFAKSFDTLKAFKNLSLERLDHSIPFPTTLWQILNHLIIWQKWQLEVLRTSDGEVQLFDESNSWIPDKYPVSQQMLDQATDTFYEQLEVVQEEIKMLGYSENEQSFQWKLIQDISLHLYFHLGEVVLMRRMMKDYPLSHQMKEFLAQE